MKFGMVNFTEVWEKVNTLIVHIRKVVGKERMLSPDELGADLAQISVADMFEIMAKDAEEVTECEWSVFSDIRERARTLGLSKKVDVMVEQFGAIEEMRDAIEFNQDVMARQRDLIDDLADRERVALQKVAEVEADKLNLSQEKNGHRGQPEEDREMLIQELAVAQPRIAELEAEVRKYLHPGVGTSSTSRDILREIGVTESLLDTNPYKEMDDLSARLFFSLWHASGTQLNNAFGNPP
jgi:hypothetical protein